MSKVYEVLYNTVAFGIFISKLAQMGPHKWQSNKNLSSDSKDFFMFTIINKTKQRFLFIAIMLTVLCAYAPLTCAEYIDTTVTIPGTYTSPWNITNPLYIYDKMIIESGGTVNVLSNEIFSSKISPYSSASHAIVTVTGNGSEWNNKTNLCVGYFDSGELIISDGGKVNK